MSESKNDTINEFFKVQQISDYQKAFEELRNRMENRKTKQCDVIDKIAQSNRSPANDNNKQLSKSKTKNTVNQAYTTTNGGNNDFGDYMCRSMPKKRYCCVLL